MQSSSAEELSDSKEDEELVESGSQALSENPNPEKSPPTKLNFMGIFSNGSSIQQTENNNDFRAFDGNSGDQKCDDGGMFAVGSSEDFPAQENFEMDNVMVNDAVHAQISHDKFGPGNFAPEFLRMDSFGMESFTCRVASHSKELDCVLQQGKLVDVISDDDESLEGSTPSSTSLFAENRDGIELLTPPCSEDHMEMQNSTPASREGYLESNGNIDMEVVVIPDFLFHGDKLLNNSQLKFSPSCVRLNDVNASGSNETACWQWSVDDILQIERQWSERAETGLVKLQLRPGSGTGEQIVHDIVKLTFAVNDPQWHEKEQRICSMSARYKVLWNSVLQVGNQEEDFMGKNSMFMLKRFLASIDEPFEDVIYPEGDPDAVSISKRDVELLQPETFINDTIIDFYIKYLKNKIQPEDRHKFHFFNSFFFRKLADLDKDPGSAKEGRAAFLRVRKWTRKINIFEKDYIFIPVNFNLHWSLIVVCHPGGVASFKDEEIDKASKVPCILHMDSIKGSHAGLKNLVQSYLWEEWKERYGESSEDVSLRFSNLRFIHLELRSLLLLREEQKCKNIVYPPLPTENVLDAVFMKSRGVEYLIQIYLYKYLNELPQQENSFDCGLFLLHYVEMFLDEAPDNLNPFTITKFSSFLNADWFPHFEASHKRSVIKKIIFEILHDHSRKNPQAALGSQNDSLKFQETNAGKEHAVEFLSERSSPSKKRDFGNSFCSSTSGGIEIELLTSSTPHGVQSDKEQEIIFREFLDSGDMAGASLAAQCGTYQEQEDVEANEHIICSSPDRVDYKQQDEMAAEPGLPLDSDSHAEIKGPEINVSLPQEIHKQARQHEPEDASPELLSSSFHNLPKARDKNNAMPIQDEDLECSEEAAAETDEKFGSALPDSSICKPENSDLASGTGLDSYGAEDTQEGNAVSECNENLNNSCLNQQNHPSPSHQDVEITENNAPGEDTQEGNAVSVSKETQGNLHLSQQNHPSPSHQEVKTMEKNMAVEDKHEGDPVSKSNERQCNLHLSQQSHPSPSHQDVETTEDNMAVECTHEGNAVSESNENHSNLDLSQQNHPSPSHQDVEATENDEPLGDNGMQLSSEDLAEESKRWAEESKRPAPKRLKLTPSEVGRRQTRSMAKECQT